VIGAGGIGSFITWAAAHAGVASVTAVDPDPVRRGVAATLGATRTLEPPAAGEHLPAADLVLEVSGRPAGLVAALDAVRPGGRVVQVGIQEPPSPVDLRAVTLRETAIVGTVAHRCAVDLPAALRLLAAREAGWSDIAPVAIPLEDIVGDGLGPLADGTATRIKTLVDPRIRAARPTAMAAAAPQPA
jgi:threonine dehydrogenase-like Zn-dependent dehydrogenase